jgi:DNA-binding NarL/FixJ family response regulator
MIAVLIVDDHAVVRHGLSQLLATTPDMRATGVADGGAEAIAMAMQAPPDVVLMDLSMPGLDGIAATRGLLESVPDARVVVLTSFAERGRVIAALDAGAIGYLLKDAEPEELLRGVRAAARGESPLHPIAAQALLAERDRPTSRGASLTARESEVLELLARGLPNKLIARQLGITTKTVKAHLTRVFATLGVSDRTAAALWAREHGIGEEPGYGRT